MLVPCVCVFGDVCEMAWDASCCVERVDWLKMNRKDVDRPRLDSSFFD
jgi:hypothetical protein